MQGEIVQINISPGGLPKRAITEGWITPLGIEGDLHAHPDIHGGSQKAILIIASEVVDALTARGYPLFYGAMGENLTTRGIDPNQALIGERWAVGSTILEVSEPRSPCYRLGLRHNDPTMHRAFVAAQRPGTYLRIIEEGDIGAGDRIEVVSRPDHDVTVLLAFQAWLIDRSLNARLRAAPQLSQAWKDWIDREPRRPVQFE
jgi:MOSC domain-containing protein YiiM